MNAWIKKLLPHFTAVIIFLVVSVIYCRPALEGKVLSQHDITQWKGAMQQSFEFKEKHGQFPLWTNSMFSGMPTFQIGYPNNNYVLSYAHKILTLGLPSPILFFFLASISFYFLCVVLRLRTVVSILGALAFAYATYNPVIISAGHETKMLTMAYMPALLGSLLLIFEKKYWTGAALTALFTGLLISMNHPQIAYYFFMTVGIMTVFFVINRIKQKDFKHIALAAAFTTVAALTGVLSNAVSLLSTYEYQKETIRGGSSVLTDTTQVANKSLTGLDKDYAFSYSMQISEPLVMMVPRMFGGSSGNEEISQENSKAIAALSVLPKELQQQLPMTYYWGGLIDTGLGTSGPPYVGAIICFLAILALFVLDGKHKWWALTAILFSIMISWGSYFKEFNTFLFDNFPLYNKFRAPSMALIIPQLLLPLLAVLGLNKMITGTDKNELWKKYKKSLIATAVVFAVLFMVYFTSGFLSNGDQTILKQVRDMNQPQLSQAVNSFYDGLKEDRKGLMLDDILRSFGFILVAAFVLFLFIKNKLNALTAAIIITVFSFIDVISIDVKYLNADHYQDKSDNEGIFLISKADGEILADPSYYRVLNFGGDPFSDAVTSYHYNSIGGYHAAKLRIYQDLIERQLRKQQPNLPVLNMLNTKYFIQKDPRTGVTQNYQKNEGALGPVWFVKHIQFVKTTDEEMNALDHFNPADTAFVQESFKSSIPDLPQPDSTASIKMDKNENDVIIYSSSSGSNQFAVFSEIYYSSGWKAFIDKKETPIVKTNYALRGLAVPAGNHTIEFRFEPKGYIMGRKITMIASIFLLLLF
ncbi:MAG TPA: YfhO family protein, partial [Chitinophagaceae bacterium]|nr:YfhO family protein [Chitinophagaceae bacterium]